MLELPASAGRRDAQEPVRIGRKVGRNEPCPCGSGKKYKRCHGAQDPGDYGDLRA